MITSYIFERNLLAGLRKIFEGSLSRIIFCHKRMLLLASTLLIHCNVSVVYCMNETDRTTQLIMQHNFADNCNSVKEKSMSCAEKYNQNNPLFLFPKEILDHIFFHCYVPPRDNHCSLESMIKVFMRLRFVCKNFNRSLTVETIGHFCKSYESFAKMCVLIRFADMYYYDNDYSNYNPWEKYYFPIRLLIFAGGATIDVNDLPEEIPAPMLDGLYKKVFRNLLSKAVPGNDVLLVALLFKYHALSNLKYDDDLPLFFCARTVEMAQLFINNRADVHAVYWHNTNVLWHITEDHRYLSKFGDHKYPAELMEFYLTHGVDAKRLKYNACLLHELAHSKSFNAQGQVDDFLKKGRLLLDAMPGMINTLNDRRQTATDIAQESLEKILQKPHGFPIYEIEAYKKLVDLFREDGGKSACELNQPIVEHKERVTSKTKRKRCIIS